MKLTLLSIDDGPDGATCRRECRILCCCRVVQVLAVLLLVARAYAQTETGQATGTVLDAIGTVGPDTRITAKNVETGATRTVPRGVAVPPIRAPARTNPVDAKALQG